MKCCNCETSSSDPHEGWQRSLETIDLWTPFERLFQSQTSAAICTASIRKSERAAALGLGHDVAALYQRKAERENAQVLRQLRTAIAAFEGRTAREDWPELSTRLTEDLNSPDTQDILTEFRERWIEILFENFPQR